MSEFNFKKKSEPAQFFQKLFEIKNTLYLSHLRQYDEKLSTHLALCDANNSLSNLVDRIVELYFGLYGTFDFKSPECGPSREPISYVETSYRYIKTNRDIFSDSSILQIIDDIQETLGTLLYKLKFVK